MDFFAQQDIARRNTRLLVFLFMTAVFVLIILTNAVVAGFLFFGEDYNIHSGSQGGVNGFSSFFSWARFGTIGLGVTATVALVVLFKWIQLSGGGKAVAESMGGTRILPQTRDAAERRCLNVVEEMALAANMPVPPVYVLNGERGINAFAAGITPADAIVAVTRGTIMHLRRSELQGVIAHEFSHILNGDMRLNIRLAAMLKGITFVGDVGQIMLRSTNRVRTGASARNGNTAAALPILGLVLWLLGWLGGLAAGFIKAAISRQREYLADASAVQYTRSSEGIADALKVIGGYVPGTLVHAARATEMSHIFFGQIEHRLWQVFATHPPLEERIARIDPQWNGEFIERKPKQYDEQPTKPGSGEIGVGRAALVAAAAASYLEEETQADAIAAEQEPAPADPDQLEAETSRREHIPLAFVRHSHEPLGAHAIVCSLLMSDEEHFRQLQFTILEESGIRGLEELVNTLYPGVSELGAPRRLPLLEMCLPALKSISAAQYRVLKKTLMLLIHADKRTDLHEWCLFQLVRHYLDPEFVQVKPSRPRYRSLEQVSYHIRVVLSMLAYESRSDTDECFRLGADSLDFPRLALMPREQCDVAAFSKAVHTLADCYPLLKPKLLKAMTQCARLDAKVDAKEREIIASMAAVMDCPVPEEIYLER